MRLRWSDDAAILRLRCLKLPGLGIQASSHCGPAGRRELLRRMCQGHLSLRSAIDPVRDAEAVVLEYLWGAAWCFFTEGDTAAEAWVRDRALAVLEGHARELVRHRHQGHGRATRRHPHAPHRWHGE